MGECARSRRQREPMHIPLPGPPHCRARSRLAGDIKIAPTVKGLVSEPRRCVSEVTRADTRKSSGRWAAGKGQEQDKSSPHPWMTRAKSRGAAGIQSNTMEARTIHSSWLAFAQGCSMRPCPTPCPPFQSGQCQFSTAAHKMCCPCSNRCCCQRPTLLPENQLENAALQLRRLS